MNLRSLSPSLVIAMLATFFSVLPFGEAPMASASGSIVHNDGNCDLSPDYLGDGSEENPYQISDSDSLWELAECDITNSATAHFVLTNDIDLSDPTDAPTGSPIGHVSPQVEAFTFSGVLDGANHEIRNISMNRNGAVGLFRWAVDASVSNLVLRGSFSQSDPTDDEYATASLFTFAEGYIYVSSVSNFARVSGGNIVGGLIGTHDGGELELTNVSNFGQVSGGAAVGGLVGMVMGHCDAFLTSVSNAADTTGLVQLDENGSVGGLIGYVEDSTIEISDSHNNGVVLGLDDAGGFVGATWQSGLRVDRSVNGGMVSASNNVGGFVGSTRGDELHLEESLNNAPVYAVAGSAGGFVGLADENYIHLQSVTNSGVISGRSGVGGLLGWGEILTIEGSMSSRPISGTDFVGGLAGFIGVEISVSNSVNRGEVNAVEDFAGGLVGYASDVEQGTGTDAELWILDSVNEGNVTVGDESSGGAVGYADIINIDNFANYGNISGDEEVGGAVGYITNSDDGEISDSRNYGEISGSFQIGGFVGQAWSWLAIVSSHNEGQVKNGSAAGGLIGQLENNGLIEFSSNVELVSGGNNVGGLVGSNWGSLDVFESYNSGSVLGVDHVGGLVGKTEDAVIYVEDAFNTGAVSGEFYVGGAIGLSLNSDDDTMLHRVLSAGTVTGLSLVDAFIGSASGLVDSSGLLTSGNSRHVARLTLDELRVATPYIGYDRVDIWGFGLCSENSGLPMLRAFSQVQTYSSSGCIQAPISQAPVQPVTSPTPTPSPVSEVVPVIPKLSSKVSSKPEEFATLRGENLELVLGVIISGSVVTVVAREALSLTIFTPKLDPGTYDIVLQTAKGTVTLSQMFESLQPLPLTEVRMITGAFARSSWLPKTTLGEVSSLRVGWEKVVCISYQQAKGVAARKKALSRVQQACGILERKGLFVRRVVISGAPAYANHIKLVFSN